MLRNCQFNIESEDIIIIQKWSIDYEKHNYIIESKSKEKIAKNQATYEEIKEYQYQKIYFMETFYQYPSLSYNQILLNLVEKYNIKNIKFTNKNFNVCKSIYQKKYIIMNKLTIN